MRRLPLLPASHVFDELISTAAMKRTRPRPQTRGATILMRSVRSTHSVPHGFTLLESLIASAMLAMVVLSVGSAVTTGQKTSLEGQKMILASMAADDLLSELRATPYADLPLFNGLTQPVGQLKTLSNESYPTTYWSIGRSVIVQDMQYMELGIGATINGRRVVVAAFDANRRLVQLETFIPEPAP